MTVSKKSFLFTIHPDLLLQDYQRLVHLFLAIMSATEEELDWDTSMRWVANKPGILDITVRLENGKESVFCTIRTISNFRTDGLLWKGTQVWKMAQVMAGKVVGPHCVLKDVWIKADHSREGNTLLSLCNSKPSQWFHMQINKHFLRTLCHGDVFVKDHGGNSQADDTCWVMMRGQDIPDFSVFNLRPLPQPCLPSDPSKTAVGHHFAMEKIYIFPKPPIKVTAQRHYQIIFKEVCRALHDKTSLQFIFKVLSEAIHGMLPF